jgi:hypothetical protein
MYGDMNFKYTFSVSVRQTVSNIFVNPGGGGGLADSLYRTRYDQDCQGTVNL